MGFGEWMIRRGAPGGTARTIGNGFMSMKKNRPGLTVAEFAESFWGMRKTVGTYRGDTLARFDNKVEGRSYNSLKHLVTHVLSVEIGNDFDDLYYAIPMPDNLYSAIHVENEHKVLYDKVIEEELAKCGVATEYI
jgi:hypothetical protein